MSLFSIKTERITGDFFLLVWWAKVHLEEVIWFAGQKWILSATCVQPRNQTADEKSVSPASPFYLFNRFLWLILASVSSLHSEILFSISFCLRILWRPWDHNLDPVLRYKAVSLSHLLSPSACEVVFFIHFASRKSPNSSALHPPTAIPHVVISHPGNNQEPLI